jgi:hypothetical protein
MGEVCASLATGRHLRGLSTYVLVRTALIVSMCRNVVCALVMIQYDHDDAASERSERAE